MTNRQKTPSWLPVLILAGLGISVIPHPVLTRTSEVSRALSPVLSSYELIRMEPGEIEQQVRTTGELRLRFNGTDLYFNLEPHDMRTPDYRAVETGPGGVTRTLPREPVHTFKGVLAGQEDTRGRFNLTDGGVEGVVYAPEGWVYVEPLRNYLPAAPAGELVVYRQSDVKTGVKTGEDIECAVSLPKRLQRGVNRITPRITFGPPTNYVIDVATEADYEFVQAMGGSEEANREILGIMNQVEGVYQSELLLQLQISFQNTWDTVNDPYKGKTLSELLDEFRTYWNFFFAGIQDYDLAHLWTGRKTRFIGRAYQSVVCLNQSAFSYGVSKWGEPKFPTGSVVHNYHTAAHEIGHNLGAMHPDSPSAAYTRSEGSCYFTIMWPFFVDRLSAVTFCKSSLEQIERHLSSYNHCLNTEPITFRPPARLRISNSSFTPATFSHIRLAWQDNSTNEMGFIVERRRVGWLHWAEIGRTGANTTTFSESGLYPGIDYIYRVRAFNEDELSAYSNQVEVTAASGPPTRKNWRIDTVAGNGEGKPHPTSPANMAGSFSGDGGPAVEASLNYPDGVALDSTGNLYIADTWNHRIRRVDANGTITTVAGSGEVEVGRPTHFGWMGAYSGDGGRAVEARLNRPTGVAVDEAGNLYIADAWNNVVRRVDAEGTITTVAGVGRWGYGGDGGPAVEARLNHPTGVAVDEAGNLYVADAWNNVVRRVDAEGTITTVAGVGRWGYGGDGGPAVEARLNHPKSVAADAAGNLYIADTLNDRIRRIDATGTITTIAGVGQGRLSRGDGPANMAVLDRPNGVAVDRAGNLYITDSVNYHIRRIDPNGIMTTIAGTLNTLSYPEDDFGGDGGPANLAKLGLPTGVAADRSGSVYIADRINHRIRVLARPPRPPAHLTAKAVSYNGIDLVWQDNSDNESGFSVQRRVDGSPDWDEVAKTIANTPRYSDTDLEPDTSYDYRVQAFNIILTSGFSNEASATTHPLLPPAVTGFTPSQGPTGTRITLTGTHFLGATAVRFNGVSATQFEVVSGISIEAVVPPGATSGPISVVTPGGTAVSTKPFTVTFPPTLIQFTPEGGPEGTRVILTGTHFLGATDIRFNGVIAIVFEVVSGTSIEAVVPRGATSGPISVVTPEGTAVSTDHFTVTTGIESRLFVPVVLRSQGRTPGSIFTSELTLTNRGSTTAEIHYTYRGSFGGGAGTAVDRLEAGRQRIVSDAVAYLTSLGIPIGSGSAGGTLRVDFYNLSSPSAAAVTVRVATPVEEGSGRAGLAFPALNPDGLLTGPAVIAGLRQNRQDRSNLAVQNAGDASDGAVTLRLTVYSGDSEELGSLVLPDLWLPPGGFHQYNGILTEAGFDNGYVKVERVGGAAAYYAYGVINDNFNSDGSFVFPVREASLEGKRGQTLPVIIETMDFASELTVTNFSSSDKQVDFSFVADAIDTDGLTTFSLTLQAGEQSILPNIVDYLRGREVAGIGRARRAFAGALFAGVSEGDMSGIVIGARTGSPGGGGQYGVFYNAAPDGSASNGSAWIYGLQQNATNRSNLALVNTGEFDEGESVFSLDLYDGETGRLVRSVTTKAIPARGWRQINSILKTHAPATAQGYVQVRKLSGSNPFLSYGVINDGGAPGERSGDGAYLPSQ